MKYRLKKEKETWNSYLINIFREVGGVNYLDFLTKYFKDPKRLIQYKEGLQQESLQKKSKKENKKITFAKKPKRLKSS